MTEIIRNQDIYKYKKVLIFTLSIIGFANGNVYLSPMKKEKA